jgi:DNA (cytosine-5)-methyltransferase 1
VLLILLKGLYGRLDKNYVFQTTVTNVEPTAKQSRVLNPYVRRQHTHSMTIRLTDTDVYKCHRMVTVRELARSQGFPDSFVFQTINDNIVTVRLTCVLFFTSFRFDKNQSNQMHRQIGNAVPWPVSEAIGRELREARLKKWRRERQEAMIVE